MSTVQEQRRPTAQATITGLALLVVGAILVFNGIPSLVSSLGSLVQWSALTGVERALEMVAPYLIFPVLMSIAGLALVRGGFGILRTQGRKGARWARSEWQQQQPQVQQRVQSAREQLQGRGGTVWQQMQPARPQASGQRPPWPGQPPTSPPPPSQRTGGRPPASQRPPSTLERMQQRIADSASVADRARESAMAKHERQASALRERAERSVAEAVVQHAGPDGSSGARALGHGRRATSILTASSLRSSSLRRTSLSLDSLRVRR